MHDKSCATSRAMLPMTEKECSYKLRGKVYCPWTFTVIVSNRAERMGNICAGLSCYFSTLVFSSLPYTPPLTGKSSSASFAHAKGILAMDSQTGFWIIHSVPQFMDPMSAGARYSYPANGKENGQTAMCISFQTKAELDHILKQLLCMRPNVYEIFTRDDISRITSKLVDLKLRRWPKNVAESTQQISSINGQSFTSYARNSKSQHKDLYLEIIAPGIGSDLLVETWRRGAGDPLPSNCSYKYKVNNVETVELKFEAEAAQSTKETSPWNYREDHSKWAVATEQPETCVGDINRMASQYKRGGGSMCMRDQQVWQIMKNSIHTVEGCPKPDRSSAVPGRHNLRDLNADIAPSSGSRRTNKPPPRIYLLLSPTLLSISLTSYHMMSRTNRNSYDL